jgi:uncharacterized protein (TIGR02722 family)
MPMTIRPLALLLVLSLGATAALSGPKVSRKDPSEVVTMTTRIESTDIQDIAARMVDSMLQSPLLEQGRPIVMMDRIVNKTRDDVDTKTITDKIRTALQRSGKVRFVANDMRDQILDEQAYQESGLVDPATAAPTGGAVGAQYLVGGEIAAIETTTGKVHDVYYKLTLNLVDIKTQIIEWSDEKEIRKQARR